MGVYTEAVQKLYVAYFSRPADKAGLAYWEGVVTANGGNTAAVSTAFANSQEYKDTFAAQTQYQIINTIYLNLFGRAAEPAGLEYWGQGLIAGRFTIAQAVTDIAGAAQTTDKVAYDNKVKAAVAFTDALDTSAEILGYTGAAANAAAKGWLAGVTTEASLTAAIVPATLNSSIAAIVQTGGAGNGGTVGQIFTLSASTTLADNLTGTANDDTFRAVDPASLTTSDSIVGGAGNDTLNISAGAFTGTIAPVISGIERINNEANGTTLSLSAVNGVQQIWSVGAAAVALPAPAVAAVFSYTGAATSTVFGTSGTSAAVAPAGAATGSAATIQTINIGYSSVAGRTNAMLATAGSGIATFDFGGSATGIEAVSINAVSGSATATIDTDVTTLDTITVTGAGRVTVVAAETTITTVDASANTGGVTYASGATAIAQAVTVTGGAGNDSFDFSGASVATSVITINAGAGNDVVLGGAARDVINGGLGNDIITGGANGDNLTGGAGNDVFRFLATTDSYIAANTNVLTTVDTIVDFNVGDDTIDLSAINTTGGANADVFVITSAVNQIAVENAVTTAGSSATLSAVATAVAGAIADGEVTWFNFGGNTYVMAETAGDDLLIQLTGTVTLTATDFIL